MVQIVFADFLSRQGSLSEGPEIAAEPPEIALLDTVETGRPKPGFYALAVEDLADVRLSPAVPRPRPFINVWNILAFIVPKRKNQDALRLQKLSHRCHCSFVLVDVLQGAKTSYDLKLFSNLWGNDAILNNVNMVVYKFIRPVA
jgi:hypothetical protein